MNRSLVYHYANINSLRGKLPELDAFFFPPSPPRFPPAELTAANRFAALAQGADPPAAIAPPPDVLGLAECKLDPDDPSSEVLPDYTSFTWIQYPHSRVSGGLAFLVRSTLIHNERLDLSYNIPRSHFQPPVRADPLAASAYARNCALAWLQVRPEHSHSCLLGLLYFHPSADEADFDAIAASLRAAAATELPIFLQGDFNQHSPAWGDPNPRSSRFADALLALCDELSLEVLNGSLAEGEVTRADPSGKAPGFVIDLAISSHSDWVDSLQILSPADTGLHSDHHSLRLTIACERLENPLAIPAAPNPARPTFNVRKADWKGFEALCARFIDEPAVAASFDALRACPAAHGGAGVCVCTAESAAATLESAWQCLRSALLDAASLAIPTRRISKYSKSWWNYPHGDLPATYRAFKAALARQQADRACLVRRKELAECRLSWRSMQRKARRWQHDELCNKLQEDPQGALSWPTWVRLTGGKSSGQQALASIVNPSDGALPTCPLEAANNLAQHFANTCRLPPIASADPLEALEWRQGDEEDEEEERKSVDEEPAEAPAPPDDAAAHHRKVLSWLASEGERIAAEPASDPSLQALFTLNTLEANLDSLKAKAVGGDSISTLFLQRGGPAVRKALLLIFNFSWVHGCMPLDWRSAEVLPLYKGKGARSDPNNYRPISLTSCVVRCLEGLIHARLYPIAERLGLLSPRQFGFRHQRGTQDALFSLTEWIKRRLNCKNKRGAPVAFLDLIKAYDRTWQAGLLFRLAQGPAEDGKCSIRGRAWAWIRAFLGGRRFRVNAAGCSSQWEAIDASVPQGAVLSPLLFAIFLDPLMRELESDDFRCAIPGLPGLHAAIHSQLFADDVAIGVDTRCDGWESAFQRALDRCAAFAARWRLRFSTAAGKSALVHFRRRSERGAVVPPVFTLEDQPLLYEAQYKFLGVVLHETLSWKPHFDYLLRRAQFASFQVLRLIPKLLSGAGKAARLADASPRCVGGPHFPAIRALVLGAVYARATYGIQFMSGSGVPAMLDRLESVCVRPLRAVLGLPRSAHIRSILAEADIPSVALFRQQLLLSFARRSLSLDAAHPSRQLLESSLATLHSIGKRGRFHPDPRNTTSSTIVSHVRDNRRPLLYDVLEAEHRWGVQVLPQKSPAQKPLQPHPAEALTAKQLEAMHGHSSAVSGVAAFAVSESPLSALHSVPSSASSSSESAGSIFAQVANPPSLSLFARKRSFAEWQHAATGGALLRAAKPTAGRSLYLYLERRPIAVLRTRLRFNRAGFAASLSERGLADSPLCALHPQCQHRAEAQTVEHALLHCPAIAAARERCRNQLRAVGVQKLDLSILLGRVAREKAAKNAAAANPPSRNSIPQAVHFPGAGASRPPVAPAVPSQRRRDELATARKILFITAALLQALQRASGNTL